MSEPGRMKTIHRRFRGGRMALLWKRKRCKLCPLKHASWRKEKLGPREGKGARGSELLIGSG